MNFLTPHLIVLTNMTFKDNVKEVQLPSDMLLSFCPHALTPFDSRSISSEGHCSEVLSISRPS